MKELYPLFGVVAIPQTPFDDDGRIDVEGLGRAVDDRLNAGVNGLLYPVVASEVGRLTIEERHTAVRVILERAAGRVPVIVGSSADDAREARAMAEFATRYGAAGALVQAPVPLMRDAQATLAYFRTVCEAPIPMLMIQDLEWGAPGLPVETTVRLFEELEPFRCIKVETVPAGIKYTALLAATQGRLNVSGGWAVPQLIEALDRGVHAVMPGGLHWPLVEIIRRYRAGDRSGAVALFERLLPMLAWQNQHIDISNQFLKLIAVRQGIFRNATLRDPEVPFDGFHRRIADELVEATVALHADLGWYPVR